QADQVGDVRQYPRLARLHELVVEQPVEVGLQHADLVGDHAEQRLQRQPLLRVADAVDRRQQAVNSVGVELHGLTSMSSATPSARVSSSAGRSPSSALPSAGASAGRYDCSPMNAISVKTPVR